jgi:hypothetical protein
MSGEEKPRNGAGLEAKRRILAAANSGNGFPEAFLTSLAWRLRLLDRKGDFKMIASKVADRLKANGHPELAEDEKLADKFGKWSRLAPRENDLLHNLVIEALVEVILGDVDRLRV